jgi:hypothetical protein
MDKSACRENDRPVQLGAAAADKNAIADIRVDRSVLFRRSLLVLKPTEILAAIEARSCKKAFSLSV